MHYLVDGYNYLHRAKLFDARRLEQGRSVLAWRLAPLLQRGERVTIFWDARGGGLGGRTDFSSPRRPGGAPAGTERETIGGVAMVFCREKDGADGAIRAFVRLAAAPQDLCVVSDDGDITRSARQLKAHAMAIRAVEKLVAPRGAPAAAAPEIAEGEEKPAPPRNRREVEDWLDYFGASEDEGDAGRDSST